MYKNLPPLIIISILIMTVPASALLYQGQLEVESLYLPQYQELKNQMALEMEIGRILDTNKLLYVRQIVTIYQEEETIIEYQLLESFMDLYLEQVSMRMGRQVTHWGSSYGVQITERLAPLDLTRKDPKTKREGIEALALDYYFSPLTTLTGIMAWDFAPHILSKELIEKREETIREELNIEILPDLIIERPDLTGLKNNQYALRWRREDLVLGVDLSLSYVWSYEQYPEITQKERERIREEIREGEALSPITLNYRKTRGPGLHINIPLSNSSLFLEAQYMENEEEEKTLEMALGVVSTFTRGTHALLQYYHKEENQKREGESLLSSHFKRPFANRHALQLNTTFHIQEKTFHMNPELHLGLGQRTSLHLGGSLERREKESGRGSDDGQVYVHLHYSF